VFITILLLIIKVNLLIIAIAIFNRSRLFLPLATLSLNIFHTVLADLFLFYLESVWFDLPVQVYYRIDSFQFILVYL